jgi:hypothetical protein
MTADSGQSCVVVLGASNVARAFPVVVAAARHHAGWPLDLLTAMGHGRGFGLENRVLGRWLPSIRQCVLWQALEQRPGRIRQALITDVGNDLMYGADPERIGAWVGDCLQRLAPRCDELVLSELPLASLQRLGPFRFHFMKKILFPRSPLSHAAALAASSELNDRVVALALHFGARLVRPPAHWYGWDPIHVRRTFFRQAWQSMCGANAAEAGVDEALISALRWAFFHFRPEYRRLFGIAQHRAQPALQLRCGTRISWY